MCIIVQQLNLRLKNNLKSRDNRHVFFKGGIKLMTDISSEKVKKKTTTTKE